MIAILLIIILGQFIQSILLLRKFNQLKFTYEEDPVRVYVAGLTQKLREVDRLRGEVVWQAAWFSKRLDKCIDPRPKLQGFPAPDPNEIIKRQQSEPFYEAYESPNSPPLRDLEERPVRYAMWALNLKHVALKMCLENFNARIQSYEKRLKRLENYLEK